MMTQTPSGVPSLRDLSEALQAKKEAVLAMGGEEAIRNQHESGKLTARERIDLLFDAGTFIELGALGTSPSKSPDMMGKETPADAVVTGHGLIDGRPACVAAYDFTVLAGSMGEVGERKVARMREMAMTQRMPMIWLLDSAGARIQEIAGAHFAGTGRLFFDQVQMSGLVPQVAAVMGPTAAGTSYIPALADFVPMVKGTSSMALAGPHLVKAAIGEDISVEDLGGSGIHTKVSGVADQEVPDDAACIQSIKQFLSYFPAHSGEKPPTADYATSLELPDDILDLVPTDLRKPYDMRKLIHALVDTGTFFDIKPDFARSIITGLARLNGYSIGIVANQPMVLGGAIDVDASDKAARFIRLCDAFNVPLLFLHDCPGFMVGSRMEKAGIIRHGAKMLFAVSELTVPKFSVIIRKSYGAGYYVMCGRDYEPDLLVGWPNCEVSLMSAEGAVNIIFRKEINEATDPEATRAQRIAQYRAKIGGEMSAGHGYLDDIIDPRETRRILSAALERAQNRQRRLPPKKHGVMPV